MSISSFEMDFYAVVVNASPWDAEHKIVYFADESTAIRVARFISDIYMPRLQGGIDVHVEPYRDAVTSTSVGLRLRATPGGAIIKIEERLNQSIYRQLLRIESLFPRTATSNCQTPVIPCGATFHCIKAEVLEKFDVDDDAAKAHRSTPNTKHIVGCYKTIEAAFKALRLLNEANDEVKTGAIVLFARTYDASSLIRLHGGRTFLERSKTFYEVKPDVDLEECRRLLDISFVAKKELPKLVGSVSDLLSRYTLKIQ